MRLDGHGHIFFTDGSRSEMISKLDPEALAGRNASEVDTGGICRIDPDGRVRRVLAEPEIRQPNGLGLSPDGSHL